MNHDHLGADRPMYWSPGPELAERVSTTLRALARRWPKAMAAALVSSDAGRDYMHDFAYALRDADPCVWPELARAYMADHEFPPGPFELRLVARRITERRNVVTPPPASPPPPIQSGHDHNRIAEVTRVFKAELGSMRDVVEAWEMLGRAVLHDPKQFAEVRAGKATPEQVSAAIVAVRNLRAKEAAARADAEGASDAA